MTPSARELPRAPWAQVPREVGAVLRPELDQLADAMIELIGSEVPEYRRPLEGAFGRNVTAGVRTALSAFVDLLGSDAELPPLDLYVRLGRGEFRQGRTLDALQSAYRLGARLAWRAVWEQGQRSGVEAPVLFHLAEAIFAYIDALAAASTAGFAEEEAVREGAAQARRHALVDLLARRPPASEGEVRRAAEAAGWLLPATVAGVALGGSADPVAAARRFPSGSLGAALEPVGVVVVPDPDGPGRRAQLTAAARRQRSVVGPAVRWTDASRSIARAVAAWPLHAAGRLGEDVACTADEHLLALLLAADGDLARDLVERRLAPLADLTPAGRGRALETLRAWLDAHGDVTATSAALHVHPQTVRYRLGTLRSAFGDALDDPTARLELALALRAPGEAVAED